MRCEAPREQNFTDDGRGNINGDEGLSDIVLSDAEPLLLHSGLRLGDALGYVVIDEPATHGLVTITFRQKGYTSASEKKRPNVPKLVHSRE